MAAAAPFLIGLVSVGGSLLAASMANNMSSPPPPPPPVPMPEAPDTTDADIQAKVAEEQMQRIRADSPQNNNTTKGALMNKDPFNLSGEDNLKTKKPTLLGGV